MGKIQTKKEGMRRRSPNIQELEEENRALRAEVEELEAELKLLKARGIKRKIFLA